VVNFTFIVIPGQKYMGTAQLVFVVVEHGCGATEVIAKFRNKSVFVGQNMHMHMYFVNDSTR
jgi:hypothetical protein